MKKTVTAYIISIFICSYAFAHGEDKAGPHGGYIRMPGAFHTEIVPNSNGQFKIYLLDINWKNPTVKNSQLHIKFLDKGVNDVVQCQTDVDYFLCQLPKGATFKKGKISVKATRENAVGNEIKYQLPLSFGQDKAHDMHGGH